MAQRIIAQFENSTDAEFLLPGGVNMFKNPDDADSIITFIAKGLP